MKNINKMTNYTTLGGRMTCTQCNALKSPILVSQIADICSIVQV